MADLPAGTVSPEIAKLSEKLQKDPNSKIFFNLAEEYYKGGMLEEALIVLQTGLKANPAYLGAKVLLGKVYADQKKIKEAREVFEQILKVNPDNIIVNKKLAVIYYDDKLLNEAEKCCNQILFFNSKDADAVNLLQKIKEAKKVPEKLPELPSKAFPEKEAVVEPVIQPISFEQEMREPARPPLSNPESGSPPMPSPEISNLKTPETKLPAEPEKSFDFSDIMKEEEVKPPPSKIQTSENGKVKSKESLETMALAELYIKQGHYGKGIEIYQKLLDQDPYNETVRQQLEDARTIGNLLGAKNPPDKVEKNIVETIIPPVELSSSPQTPPFSLSPKNLSKIARLRQWLEILKKVH